MVNFIKGEDKVVMCINGCKQKFKVPVNATYCTCPHCNKKLLLAYLGTIDGHFH